MRWVFSFLMIVHGLIHLMGPAKAFGYADLPQLTQPISRGMGLLWLVAAALMGLTVTALFAWPRWWWAVGGVACLVSQLIVMAHWTDAKAGTAANIILLLGVVYGCLTAGPWSFRATYEREATAGLARPVTAPVVTEADLAPLPDPVRRYMRATGMVGSPRIHSYRLKFRGRIRSAPDARWMPFVADQQSFVDKPTRLFLMQATFLGVPIQAFHRLADGHATMRVKAVGLVPVADARGPEMDRAEAVTLFNDMCLLAPGTLLDAAVTWEAVDTHTARGFFTHAGQRISATLSFDAEGLLTNFVSDDRSRSNPDGTSFSPVRFSTPVFEYRTFGPYRLAARADARWHPPTGEFAYGEFEVVETRFNLGARD